MIDLAIIGGGPAGYVAAERAGARGLKVVLFEAQSLGGVCLNEGCIPTKTLLYSAKLLDQARAGAKYGIEAGEVSYDFKKIMSRKKKVIRKLVGGVGMKMKNHQVEVVNGWAHIEGKEGEAVKISCKEETYLAKNLLICTGSSAYLPPISGMDASEVLTNREILELTEVPNKLIIIGGGVIGTEFASIFNSLGTEVHVIEMMDEILGGMDVEQSAMLRKAYEAKGVKFYLQSKVTAIQGRTVVFEQEGKEGQLEGDQILVSVGRRANVEGFGLENLGVELDRGGIKVNKQLETNVPHVFAAGDVTGFSLLAHTASREGEVVVNNLLGRKDVMRYHAIPGVVYTNPEISGVGLTEELAREKGIAYKVAKLPMVYAGRFVAENESALGECKVLVGDKYGEVLGVHMIGNPSSEMIYGACMAIESELTLREMEEIVFPHPTVSEIFKETIFSFEE